MILLCVEHQSIVPGNLRIQINRQNIVTNERITIKPSFSAWCPQHRTHTHTCTHTNKAWAWKATNKSLVNGCVRGWNLELMGWTMQNLWYLVFPVNSSTHAFKFFLLPCEMKFLLTWFRFPGPSLRPGPQWTSLPSSSRWAGWRHRCSQKTPGKSGSKHFLQRQTGTRYQVWLSCLLVKGTVSCAQPKKHGNKWQQRQR